MEITSFVLGILSVVFLLGIIVGVFGARKITKLENETSLLTREINECHRHISRITELDNRRIDGEIDRTNRMVDNVSSELHRRIDIFSRDVDERFGGLYRDLDSRFDKLENRLKAETKGKQLLKD